jgi:predicted flap endonuclease-1-like 5' DNA nuclease
MFHNPGFGHTFPMEGITSEVGMYLLAAAVAGGLIGWLLRGAISKRGVNKLNKEWQTSVADISRQRDRLKAEVASLHSNLEDQEAVVRHHESEIARSRTDLDTAHEKAKLMSKDLFNLRAEREDFKAKIVAFQKALIGVKKQSDEMHEAFHKSSAIYKRELAKAFEKRKALEVKIDSAKVEYESFSNLLQASRSEQESVNRMLDSARNRLANVEQLEQTVIKLEAENAQLNHDAIRMGQENEALKREVAELDELKIQNTELARCLESIENSRKQYEVDAKRHRENAGQHEKRSETLRLKLDEVEKHIAEMEEQQRQALKDAREAAVTQVTTGELKVDPPPLPQDDLKDIIGIGKVFEHTLHELGIFTFKQIADFDAADIARVNAELKEFKGRMEQDDWIGQAKELHYKKYGGSQ